MNACCPLTICSTSGTTWRASRPRLTAPDAAPETLEDYGVLQARFEHAGGYTLEVRIRQVLGGLGFSPDDYGTPLDLTCRAASARVPCWRACCSSRPNLLILDEPTNHLDTEAIEWLESYIKDWQGAVIVVSHDRYLLDRVCNNIWEMSGAGFEAYRGNYSHYLKQREERWQLRSKEFQAEKLRLSREMDYIKRNIAAQNVAQSRGRLRRLSRQIQAMEQIGLDAMRGKTWMEISEDVQIAAGAMSVEEAEQRLKALRNPLQRPRQLKFKLRAAQRSGNIVLSTGGITVGYPGKTLFTAPAFALGRTACAALIGPNGSGKTTFLRTILGRIPPLAGHMALGASLDIGYFAQAREDLDPGRTVADEIQSVARHMLLPDVRDYLARYLFTGDEVFKKVEVLSGGERGTAGPGQARPGQRQRSVAGRADQSPRHPFPGNAAERPGGLRGHHNPGVARPLPDRRPGDPGLGDRQAGEGRSGWSRAPTANTARAGRRPARSGRLRRTRRANPPGTTAAPRSARPSAKPGRPRTARSPTSAAGRPASPRSEVGSRRSRTT